MAVSGLVVPSASVALDGSERLPDIGMLPPRDFSIQQRPKGVRWLRFDAIVVNIGPGDFEIEGRGTISGNRRGNVVQLIETDGAPVVVETPAEMFYAGDGHDHWHVEDMQHWTIASMNDRARPLRSGEKRGFCFWDNYRYGSLADPTYHPTTTSACETRGDDVVPMGLSVGWGDEYPSTIAFQYIDITGLPNGDYEVRLVADPATLELPNGEFVEAEEGNNTSWAIIRITRKVVTVLSSGTDLEP